MKEKSFWLGAYFQKKNQEKEEKAVRFFNISQRLPRELQMVLSNRAYGLSSTLVPRRDTEILFRSLTKEYAKPAIIPPTIFQRVSNWFCQPMDWEEYNNEGW